jgi:hypothetical protein
MNPSRSMKGLDVDDAIDHRVELRAALEAKL